MTTNLRLWMKKAGLRQANKQRRKLQLAREEGLKGFFKFLYMASKRVVLNIYIYMLLN